MKYLVLIIHFFFVSKLISQELIPSIYNIKPTKDYKNIYVKKISSDSLSSAFIIWIKRKVKLHKHIFHTENVYILNGRGKFQLNDSIFNVRFGDLINIPKNTWHGVVINSKKPMKVISIQSPEFFGYDRVFKN